MIALDESGIIVCSIYKGKYHYRTLGSLESVNCTTLELFQIFVFFYLKTLCFKWRDDTDKFLYPFVVYTFNFLFILRKPF